MTRTPRAICTPPYPRELTSDYWRDIKIPKDYNLKSLHDGIAKTLRLIEINYLELKLYPQVDILDSNCNAFRECVDGCNRHLCLAIEAIEKLLPRLRKLITSIEAKGNQPRKHGLLPGEYAGQANAVENAAGRYVGSLKKFIEDLVAWRVQFRPQDKAEIHGYYRIAWRDPRCTTR